MAMQTTVHMQDSLKEMLFVCFFHSHKKFVKIILLHNKSDKVFKNGPSKIFQRMSSTNFTLSNLEYFVPYVKTYIFYHL